MFPACSNARDFSLPLSIRPGSLTLTHFGFKLVWLDLIDIFPFFFPPCLGFCRAQTRVDVFEKMLMNQKKSLYKLSRIGYLLTPVEVGSLVREPK